MSEKLLNLYTVVNDLFFLPLLEAALPKEITMKTLKSFTVVAVLFFASVLCFSASAAPIQAGVNSCIERVNYIAKAELSAILLSFLPATSVDGYSYIQHFTALRKREGIEELENDEVFHEAVSAHNFFDYYLSEVRQGCREHGHFSEGVAHAIENYLKPAAVKMKVKSVEYIQAYNRLVSVQMVDKDLIVQK